MALGIVDQDTKRKIYLSISHGRVVHYLTGGNAEYFKNVGGKLQNITVKERSFNGKNARFWYMDLRDGQDLYTLSLPFASGTFKSIILALASAEGLNANTEVLIEPYEKNNYTKVVVYASGQKLDWVTKELPPLREQRVGDNVFTDDTERMQYIYNLASQVKERIGKGRLV